jgi:hypothetical protein
LMLLTEGYNNLANWKRLNKDILILSPLSNKFILDN